MTNDEFRLNF